MFHERGIGEVLDRTMHPTPATRLVPVGSAGNAMVLHGLGVVNQPLYLGPMFFPNKPTPRLIAPGGEAQHLHDATLGRALAMLWDYGVTARYRLRAATAAQRLGRVPTCAHLDRTSVHVEGRDNSVEAPAAPVIHITRGHSRAHRPALNHVMRDLSVEQQAGIPRLMTPLRGKSSDGQDFGQVVTEHLAPLQTTYGTTDLVADSALYRDATLQKLVETRTKWSTRVPTTVSEAPAVLAEADPQTMTQLMAGYRSQQAMSTDGGVPQRWMLVDSASRRPPAPRMVDQYWRKQSAAEAKALQQRGRTADAQHALPTVA